MDLTTLLPPLLEDPRDAAAAPDVNQADEVIYRLGLGAEPIPGLPETLSVGGIGVSFVRGPVRAQATRLRQRHGFPPVFDKYMTRSEVAEGELVALFTIRRAPVPAELERAFGLWRGQALAAAGLVASVLDERAVGRELFEDAVLLRNGQFLGAADMRSMVRTFLPIDVTAADQTALAELSTLSVEESSAVARAARLYRRAALEGPSADSYAMLWVAAECFSAQRSPSRKEIEAALVNVGIEPAGLPLHVGQLIDLRGKIQHHGVEEDDRLVMAFYEMEAIVRSLIRTGAGITGGWWPAPGNPAGFSEPFDEAVAALQSLRQSQWHADGLPAAGTPEPARLPRRVPDPAGDSRLDLDPQLGEAADLIAAVVIDAIEWQDPNLRLAVRVAPDAGKAPYDNASADTIWLPSEAVTGFDDPDRPEVLINLVWNLHSLVATVGAQRAGIKSHGDGVALISSLGAWYQYNRLINWGEFDADLLEHPVDRHPASVGKLAGWAAAGDARAEQAILDLDDDTRPLASQLMEALRRTNPGPPIELLQDISTAEG